MYYMYFDMNKKLKNNNNNFKQRVLSETTDAN